MNIKLKNHLFVSLIATLTAYGVQAASADDPLVTIPERSAELHIVSTIEGKRPSAYNQAIKAVDKNKNISFKEKLRQFARLDRKFPGKVVVKVSKKAPVTLFLASMAPVEWNVTFEQGTSPQAIIVAKDKFLASVKLHLAKGVSRPSIIKLAGPFQSLASSLLYDDRQRHFLPIYGKPYTCEGADQEIPGMLAPAVADITKLTGMTPKSVQTSAPFQKPLTVNITELTSGVLLPKEKDLNLGECFLEPDGTIVPDNSDVFRPQF